MNSSLDRRQMMIRIAAGAAAAGLPWASASAQTPSPSGWPSRPVRMIIPSGAGAQTDLFARSVADHLAKTFGQPFIADNRPGASGNIGTMAVLSAPADGYSLLFSAASFTIVPAALRKDMPYDLQRDLIPVVRIGIGGLFLAVAPDLPVQNIQELFELVRKEPGRYSYGTTGIGSTGHLIMASLLQQRGLSMSHAPYKSSAEVLRDLLGGVLKVAWVDTTSSLGAIRASTIRVLAHGSTERAPLTPNVAPLKDLGVHWDLNGWLGLFVKAGTPMTIVNAINAEVNRFLNSEEGKSRLTAMNIANPPSSTSEEFAAMIRRDLPQWRKIAQDNQINPQN